MLPRCLLALLIYPALILGARQGLTVNAVVSSSTQGQTSFSIPPNPKLSVSVALCSATANSQPRFFISNTSNLDSESNPGPQGGANTFEIILKDGQGHWTGGFPNGGILAVDTNGASGISFDIGVSDGEPLHETLSALPLLGDSTSNQVLMFSYPFLNITIPKPTYPNYTLPAANMSQPQPPSTFPNFTLVLSQTTSNNNPRTGCFLAAQSPQGTVSDHKLWARDVGSWRSQWLIEGLKSSTNYTAFVLQDTTKVSGPIFFATKSATFPCPLVHSLPYCPSVAYAVPLPPPSAPLTSYTDPTLPSNLTAPLLSYLANFTTVLTTLACGRDWYSPVVDCSDCAAAYRRWLCNISFMRCSEPSPANPNGITSAPAAPSATGIIASQQEQEVLSALIPLASQTTPRNPFLPLPTSGSLTGLLPCIEQCTLTDRSCPPFIGFKCPTRSFNAGASYGVGYIDSADGDELGGLTGTAQDPYGNVWCNFV